MCVWGNQDKGGYGADWGMCAGKLGHSRVRITHALEGAVPSRSLETMALSSLWS